ncbi:MAG: hypothetical protein HYT61_03240 [Candidatus Yanofskybacteria bacterium]|nr:hypothetical protein [Candidatus Yanofskybacteria bacterium]
MTVAKLNLTKIEAILKKKQSEIQLLEQNVAKLSKQTSELKQQLAGLESKKYSLELDAQSLIQAAIVSRGAEQDVLKSRNELINLLKEVVREDITIARQKELRVIIDAKKFALQQKCDHRFVMEESGYIGSYSNDYEDAFHGHRLCVVCNFRESETRICQKDYKKLNADIHRLITPSHSRLSKITKEIWQPLEPILEEFLNTRVFKILEA